MSNRNRRNDWIALALITLIFGGGMLFFYYNNIGDASVRESWLESKATIENPEVTYDSITSNINDDDYDYNVTYTYDIHYDTENGQEYFTDEYTLSGTTNKNEIPDSAYTHFTHGEERDIIYDIGNTQDYEFGTKAEVMASLRSNVPLYIGIGSIVVGLLSVTMAVHKHARNKRETPET